MQACDIHCNRIAKTVKDQVLPVVGCVQISLQSAQGCDFDADVKAELDQPILLISSVHENVHELQSIVQAVEECVSCATLQMDSQFRVSSSLMIAVQ